MAKESRIRIEAPEKIVFSYRYAEPGARMAAFFLDMVIQAVILILFALLFWGILNGDSLFSNTFSENFGMLGYGFFYLLLFFMQWFYFLLFEAFWNGRTPGKRVMKIRVIKKNGEALDFSSLLLRNFMRAVDGFPTLHIIGGIVCVLDRENRRIGDILAQTLVVYDNQKNTQLPDFSVPFEVLDLYQKEIHEIRSKRSLDEKDLYVIRRYFNEREKIPVQRRQAVIEKLAAEVRKKLELDDMFMDPTENEEQFLIRVYSAHAKEDSN